MDPLRTEIPSPQSHVAAPRSGRLRGYQVDCSGERISAVQRALRPAQHLNALQIGPIKQGALGFAHIDAIKVDTHGRIKLNPVIEFNAAADTDVDHVVVPIRLPELYIRRILVQIAYAAYAARPDKI